MNQLRKQVESSTLGRTFQKNRKSVGGVVALLVAFGAGYGARAQGESDWMPQPSPVFALMNVGDGHRLLPTAYASVSGKLGQTEQAPNGKRFADRATSSVTSSTRLPRKATPKPYQTLEEVRRAIRENFVQPEVGDEELTYGAIRGMLSSLGDRFTRFLTPDEYLDFKQKNEGEFTGIGARIDLKDDYQGSPAARPLNASRPYIVEAMTSSPAQRGGLQAGDVILEINGRSTANKSADAVVTDIKGVRGTTVNLKIERKLTTAQLNRDSTYKVFEIALKRDLIVEHPVKLEWMPGNIAWLRLSEFNERSDAEMTAALSQIKSGLNGMPTRGLIFDMRDNPGGLLNGAIQVGSRFISSGPIVSTRERDGKTIPMNAQRERFLGLKLPIVVMVNNYSASAAEIVAGAMKDRRLATVVGEPSYGKASVQVLIELQNGGALVITTAKYLTPLGHDISDKGITPDVVVKANTQDTNTGRGAQLTRAL
ncbi:MAG TPA: S41 family peptidase [Abditibacteriaceae bacterium]|nr:S41 family peptidase [Abditibacteriaceae bacterium]